ncbi:MAG: hypothetical protein JF615_16945 [Asticcacaulis sp.]|nr:hypothetical protein [Asticcacaulis sp.]
MATATQTSGNSTLVTVLAVAIIAIIAVAAIYLMQDHRSSSERVSDAIQTLPKGVGKAADKLDDQPPAQNVERNIDKAVN